MASIVLRARILYHAPRAIMLSVPQTPLEFLTVCLPMLNCSGIRKSLSTTNNNGIVTQKESVWTNHIFTAAWIILPPTCVIDPQITADSGQVDVEVHNGVEYYLEFLISNFAESTSVENVPDVVRNYVLHHVKRFTPTGEYRSKQGKPCAVVNITRHDPPPMMLTVPECFATVFHYVIKDLNRPYLTWQADKGLPHKIVLPFDSCPRIYNPGTRTLLVHPSSSQQKMQALI